ncbi:MAG TPA: hypothetical protein PK177_15355, partial [Burkholderiaceae bacterium]|nr:hypothetical protein [Burkholderiaceae bacterium]
MNKRLLQSILTSLAGAGGLATILALPGFAQAEIPLTDSRNGVTCHFYASLGRLEWRQPGGDWLDATAKPYGQEAFALAQVPQAGSQKVRFDVTTLTGQWNQGMRPSGAMMVRTTQSRKAGIVNFSTREDEDPSSHPVLHIQWDDGQRASLEATADTYQSCPTHRSLGDRKFIQVGDQNVALFVFPFEPRSGRQVTKASLELTSSKQYGGGAQLGIY